MSGDDKNGLDEIADQMQVVNDNKVVNITQLDDKADLEFLGKIDTMKDKVLSIPVGGMLNPPYIQAAMQRAAIRGWIRMIDLIMASATIIVAKGQPDQMLSRVYVLTEKGQGRLATARGNVAKANAGQSPT